MKNLDPKEIEQLCRNKEALMAHDWVDDKLYKEDLPTMRLLILELLNEMAEKDHLLKVRNRALALACKDVKTGMLPSAYIFLAINEIDGEEKDEKQNSQ